MGNTHRTDSNNLLSLSRNGKSEMLAPGRYECELVKSAGKWRFQRRVVILDHDITLDGI